MTISSEITHYLRHEHEPIEIGSAAKELARLYRLRLLYNGEVMARGVPESMYLDAIAALVRSGDVLESGGKVWLPVAKVSKQGELF